MISAYQIYTEESATKNIPNFSNGQNTVVRSETLYIKISKGNASQKGGDNRHFSEISSQRFLTCFKNLKKNALLNFDNFNAVIMFWFFFECGLILHSSVKQKKNQD